MKSFFICLAFTLALNAGAQNGDVKIDSIERVVEIAPKPVVHTSPYRLKPAVDIPLTAVGTGWSLYAFTKIYSKDTSTTARILALDKNDISKFNRHGVKHFSEKANKAADLFFYTSMPLPLILLADKAIRKDAGKVGLLFLESMSVTGLLYTGAVYFHDKYRPYAYNPNVPIGKRKGGGGKNSFFAGHVALVGTSTFFMAKVYSDYHPQSKIKWLLYSIAGTATAATGYLRYKGGQHFLSDILIGAAVGPLSGLLVPHFHKVWKGDKLSFTPYFDGTNRGVALSWRL